VCLLPFSITFPGSDDLESTFQSRLQSIGRVLVLFDEWSKPAYLTLGTTIVGELCSYGWFTV
jgi:hypothetical protein